MSDLFVVGPGVAQAISDAGAEARSDEQFICLTPGDKVSLTLATDGQYFWFERDNLVKKSSF